MGYEATFHSGHGSVANSQLIKVRDDRADMNSVSRWARFMERNEKWPRFKLLKGHGMWVSSPFQAEKTISGSTPTNFLK
jgi:hypothetical protein